MKYFLNGFPKAGVHLLEALIKPLTLNRLAWWAGTQAFNGWSKDKIGIDMMTNGICYVPDNHRIMGHCCYDDDIEWYIELSAIVHIFIWRDLRDVAVSQAHHVISDNDYLRHPNKDIYRQMDSFEDVLDAVWNGYDKYPGVLERWAEFEPWLHRPSLLVIKYEDVIADTNKIANEILDYSASIQPARALPDGQTKIDNMRVLTTSTEMVASARDTDKCPTFRRGIPGEWRKYRHIFERNYERI